MFVVKSVCGQPTVVHDSQVQTDPTRTCIKMKHVSTSIEKHSNLLPKANCFLLLLFFLSCLIQYIFHNTHFWVLISNTNLMMLVFVHNFQSCLTVSILLQVDTTMSTSKGRLLKSKNPYLALLDQVCCMER